MVQFKRDAPSASGIDWPPALKIALVKLAFKATPLSVHENEVMVAAPPTMVLEAVVVPEACKENRAVRESASVVALLAATVHAL